MGGICQGMGGICQGMGGICQGMGGKCQSMWGMGGVCQGMEAGKCIFSFSVLTGKVWNCWFNEY